MPCYLPWCRERLGLTPSEQTRAYVQWLVPRELEGRLPGFLSALEAAAPALAVTDIQISLTSLEEVQTRRCPRDYCSIVIEERKRALRV